MRMLVEEATRIAMAKIRIDMKIPDATASHLLRMLRVFDRLYPGFEITVSGSNGEEVARALTEAARFVVMTEEPDGTVH
jgi:hypothetical protein